MLQFYYTNNKKIFNMPNTMYTRFSTAIGEMTAYFKRSQALPNEQPSPRFNTGYSDGLDFDHDQIGLAKKFAESKFSDHEIVDLYNKHHEEVKGLKLDSLDRDNPVVQMLENVQDAFKILDNVAKTGTKGGLSAQDIKKMEPKTLEKVQNFLKEAVNSFVKAVTFSKKEEVFKTQEHKDKAGKSKEFGDRIKGARAAAAKTYERA
jgi:hypothetical protein